MDHSDLLSGFQARIDQFRKYQGFIERAREQSARFTAAVVDKVVKDNTEKQFAVVAEIMPLLSQIDGVMVGLRSDRAATTDSVKDSQLRLEELELRQAIGEISDEDFESEASGLKGLVAGVDARIAAIDEEVGSLQAALDSWAEVGRSAGMAPPEATATIVGVDRDSASRATIEVGEIDLMGDSGGPSVVATATPLPMSESEGASDRVRRAVLLYAEGTAEEQIYPFPNETLSLGRGRDNDIQVKNDSKVSRYHCKLFRKVGNFHIEDNKSANGTLVNGELITERRLFGGEEVIIGETFFRFRILD